MSDKDEWLVRALETEKILAHHSLKLISDLEYVPLDKKAMYWYAIDHLTLCRAHLRSLKP